MLDLQSWLPKASSLQIGQKRYAEHECGAGRKLVLSRDTSGFSAWCFRCNDSGWAPGPKLSLAERVAEARRAADADTERVHVCSFLNRTYTTSHRGPWRVACGCIEQDSAALR
jgi:hypothetical protein